MGAAWVRRDEGEHVCAALLAQGDDQPFYKRIRSVVNDATNAGEPLRVVISTDDNEVAPGTNAAFIATARLVQQFLPLEIWWQGAWLNHNRSAGFISLVPLVQGDMDFARLDFCIADERRDSFSFHVMASHCVLDIQKNWNGCGQRAEWSYLDHEGVKFIDHNGIKPEGESIANTAAKWLGWDPISWESYAQEGAAHSAAQSLPEPERKYDGPTAADRARWDRDAERRRQREREEAEARMNKAE